MTGDRIRNADIFHRFCVDDFGFCWMEANKWICLASVEASSFGDPVISYHTRYILLISYMTVSNVINISSKMFKKSVLIQYNMFGIFNLTFPFLQSECADISSPSRRDWAMQFSFCLTVLRSNVASTAPLR